MFADGLSLESEWQQVSLGLQNSSRILDNLNVGVWVFLILPLISSSSSHFYKLLGTDPSIPTRIAISVTPMFHIFLVFWQEPSICPSFHFFIFTLWSPSMVKSMRWQVPFLLLINYRTGLLTRIRWSILFLY